METWKWIALAVLVVGVALFDVRTIRAARDLVSLRQARRAVIFVLGSTLLLIGVVLLLMPGPGIPLILVALGMLAAEFAWAKRLLDRVKRMVKDAGDRITGKSTEAGDPPIEAPPAERDP